MSSRTRAPMIALCLSFALATRAAADDLPTTLPDDAAAPPDEEYGPPLRFEGSLMAALSAPLAHNPDVAGFGFAVTYGMGWGEIPLTIGLDFMSIGSIGDANDKLSLMLGDESTQVERTTHTRSLHFEGWLRLTPAHWRFRPYLEGFIGTQQYQAKYVLRVTTQNLPSDPVSGSAWAHSYGWGLGLECVGLLNRSGSMSLTLGMRRVYGGTAHLTRPATVAGQTIDTELTAGTSTLVFMIGVGGHYDLSEPRPDGDFLGD
jgi:hypothetical protein